MPAPVASFAVRQVNFSNGEIAPTLYGDVSHPKFLSSLRTCKNWLPIQNGALVKWPGTKFVGYTKFGPASPCRMIPFTFSDNQSFLLEVGDQYIRFWQKSQYVGVDGNLHTYGDGYAGGYYEVVTPFVTDDVSYLKFAQVGNVITMTVGGQTSHATARAPQDLKHTPGALTPWVIGATSTKIPAGAVTWPGGGPTDAVGGFTYTGATTGPVWGPGQRAFFIDGASPTNLVEWICIQNNTQGQTRGMPGVPGQTAVGLNSTSTSLAGNLWWMPAVDLDHPAIKQNWVQTAVVQDANGVVYESAPSPVLTIDSSLSNDRQRPIVPATPTLAAGYTLLLNKMYRGSPGGIYGLVDSITVANLVAYPANAGTVNVWLDDGRTPDFTHQPPKATDPFLVNGADAYPAVISYLDQRRIFAGGAGLPNGLSFSRDGDFYNWDATNIPGADTDALNLLLASEVLEQVRSFVSLARGVCLTGQGEFTIAGANGGALSRSSRSAIRQSRWGSSWLNPIIIGKGLLFNTAKSNQVRDFYPLYGLYNDVWDGQDLTVAARHLFENHAFTVAYGNLTVPSDWSYQSVPYPVIRAVRDDGTLVCLTYQHAPPSFGQQLTEGVAAWSRRATGVGWDSFQSTCVVPEPPEDAVYYATTRAVGGATVRLIEREASPILSFVPALYAPAKVPTATIPGSTGVALPDARYGVFMDASLQFDGHVDPTVFNNNGKIDSVANPGSTNPADFAQGSQVTFQTNGSALFLNTDPNTAIIQLDPENVNGLGSLTLKVTGYISPTRVTCDVLDSSMTQAQLQYLWGVGYGVQNPYWAIGRSSYTVAHLSGYQVDSGQPNGARGVWVLADGYQVDPQNFTWVAGVLTLAQPAVVVCIGIAYNADAELLDAFHPNKELRNLKKTLTRMGFEVANTRDMYVGRDAAHLRQWIEKRVSSSWSFPLDTGYFEVLVDGSTDKDGRALFRHHTPLPATLTSVLREYDLGGT